MVRKKVEMPKIERAIRTAAFNVRGYVQRGIIELRFRNKIRNIKVASANEDDFEYEISIVAIFKNEAEYILRYPKNNTKIAVSAPKNEIRINHYYSKSVEEFVAKSNRGFADHIGLERSMQNFYEHDQNIESDGRMDSLITELKDKFQNSDLIARRRDEI